MVSGGVLHLWRGGGFFPVHVDVKPMDNSFEWTGLTLCIFDDLFRDRELSTYRVGREKNAVTFKSLWEKRPEWGGMILELMKKNQTVHLCVGGIDVWYRVVFYTYGEGEDFFQFIREKPPVMDAYRNCLISTAEFLHRGMEYTITDLMEPMRFGQSIKPRLFRRGQVWPGNKKPKAEFTGGDYRDLCYELETLITDVMHQRDLWKDRFFFQAMEAEDHELCNGCKKGMRQAFYDNGYEFEALRWRPGQKKNEECRSIDFKYFSACKDYGSKSIEDLDHIHPN